MSYFRYQNTFERQGAPTEYIDVEGYYDNNVVADTARELEMISRDAIHNTANHEDGFHTYPHPRKLVDTHGLVFTNIDFFPLMLNRELEEYNKTVSETEKVDDQYLYALLKIAFIGHDMGNLAQLDPELLPLLDENVSLKELLEKFGTRETVTIPLSKHTELGAEDRSKQITKFFYKQALALQQVNSGYRTKARRSTEESIDFEQLAISGCKFIDAIIEYTRYQPNEDNTLPFAKYVRFMDRVGIYLGDSIEDVVVKVKNLAKEKKEEKPNDTISIFGCINFPWIELRRILPDQKERLAVLNFFANIKATKKMTLPPPILKDSLSDRVWEILNKKVSWGTLYNFLQDPTGLLKVIGGKQTS